MTGKHLPRVEDVERAGLEAVTKVRFGSQNIGRALIFCADKNGDTNKNSLGSAASRMINRPNYSKTIPNL